MALEMVVTAAMVAMAAMVATMEALREKDKHK